MKLENPDPVDARIAARVHALRTAEGLSLESLAARSGVSRSMISRIERGQSSATAVLLEKIATALDVPLAALFNGPPLAADPVARRSAQPVWRDPGSGYVRRNVSPAGIAAPLQIVEVTFPAQARVAYESGTRATRIHQQVWVLEGCIEVTVGRQCHRLEAGDCLALELDQPTMFHNPGDRPARYAVVLAGERIAHG